MSDIFISYFHHDRPHAEMLARALEAEGLSVWWDRTIPAGRNFDQVIEEALNAAKVVIVLWSRGSVKSRWVLNEAEEAAARSILVPVFIEERVRIPLAFRRIQAANLVGLGWIAGGASISRSGGHPGAAHRQPIRIDRSAADSGTAAGGRRPNARSTSSAGLVAEAASPVPARRVDRSAHRGLRRQPRRNDGRDGAAPPLRNRHGPGQPDRGRLSRARGQPLLRVARRDQLGGGVRLFHLVLLPAADPRHRSARCAAGGGRPCTDTVSCACPSQPTICSA